MSLGSKPREPLAQKLLRLIALVAAYAAGYYVLDAVAEAVPEVRMVLTVLGLLSIPVVVWLIWRRDYDQPPRRGI
jgi:hypothetical protein